MIDTTEDGFVYNPKTQPEGTVAVSEDEEDAVAGVRVLQIAGRSTLRGSDSRTFEDPETHTAQVDSYFLLDTQIGKQIKVSNYEALRDNARDLGIPAKLEPIAAITLEIGLPGLTSLVHDS